MPITRSWWSQTGSNDPAGFDVVVNATPLGMKEGDPLPFDVTRIDPAAMVGEVVMKTEYTPLLQAALAKGCGVQVGTDMLFEMIPAYLELSLATAPPRPMKLRAVAQIKYLTLPPAGCALPLPLAFLNH